MISTESLKELLKIEPKKLYDSIIIEIKRREDVAANISSIPPTRSHCCPKLCLGHWCNKKCEAFHRKNQVEDHYILQVSTDFHRNF